MATSSKTTKTPKSTKIAEGDAQSMSSEEAQELEGVTNDMLSGLPAMREGTALRLRHKNQLANLALMAQGLDLEATINRIREKEDGSTVDYKDYGKLFDFTAAVDDVMRGFAVDEAAYDAWVNDLGMDANPAMLALFFRYQTAVSESSSSTP